MSTQTLSQTQKDQLRQMLSECGLKNVHLGIGDILKEEHPEEGKYAKQTKKQTKTQIRKNKKMIREAKAEELAEKIKATHDIDVNPTEFTLNALNKILRTGEMQEKRKKKGKNGYMRFLTQERVENKKRTEPIPSNELVKLTGQKWRDMTDEQKAVWNTAEPTVEKQTDEPTAEKQTDEPTAEKQIDEPIAEPTAEKQVEEPKKATKATKATKAAKAPKMTKPKLKIHLTEKYGWDAKLLCKFNVTELRQAKETGELPTEAMEKRKSQNKKDKKSKKVKVTETETMAEPEAADETVTETVVESEPEPQTTDGNPLSMFDDMSESEDEDESN